MTNYILGAAASDTAVLDGSRTAVVTAAPTYLVGAVLGATVAKPAAVAAVAVAADCAGRLGSFSPAARHRRPRAMSVIEYRHREKSR